MPATQPASGPASGPATQASSRPAPTDAGPIPAEWVEPRAAAAESRLQANEAGQWVMKAIEAHGGLRRWLGFGTIDFTFDYRPLNNPARRMNTRSRVDLWRSRARQDEVGPGADARLGWDGQRAWITPERSAFPITPRFWATTPYYFVGMPFVLADPGVRFERLADAKLDDHTYVIVKATFDPGTGDSPDDYYILYLDPKTARMAALRYIVAYPGFFKAGKHSPEKLMRYEEHREVQGLLLPHRLDTFQWEATGVGPKVTSVNVGDYALGSPIEGSVFAPLPDAEVVEGL